MIDYSFGFYGIAFFGIILFRYFLAAGGTYLFFYSSLSQFLVHPRKPYQSSEKLIRHDIKLSIISSAVFALAAALIMSAYTSWGTTRLYIYAQQYGLWYLGASYVAVLFLQDAYFYLIHRLLHHPLLFPWLHQEHHQSRHPTPWTSFAFDPLEAIAQSLFLVGIVFVIPLHFITLIAVLMTMTVWAVINHLGIDRLPLSFPHNWLGRWFIVPAHHSIHHLKYTVHCGLYFTFWDQLFRTQDSSYPDKIYNRFIR